jgi:hypothetical protein
MKLGKMMGLVMLSAKSSAKLSLLWRAYFEAWPGFICDPSDGVLRAGTSSRQKNAVQYVKERYFYINKKENLASTCEVFPDFH